MRKEVLFMNYDVDQIIAELDSIDDFDQEELNEVRCDCIWDEISNKTCYNYSNADYGSGASKFVIIPKDTDYVIKIPFTTLDTEESYYNAENHEWHYGNPEPLQHEYCFRELEHYNYAKVCYSGAEIFLAKTERVYTGKTINGYVQEKVIDYYEWCRIHEIKDLSWRNTDVLGAVKNTYKSYNANSSIDQVVSQYNNIPAIWWNQLYKYATENDKMEEVEQFFDFLIDTSINDLCGRNIGFIGDKPVLMDYAGWDEW